MVKASGSTKLNVGAIKDVVDWTDDDGNKNPIGFLDRILDFLDPNIYNDALKQAKSTKSALIIKNYEASKQTRDEFSNLWKKLEIEPTHEGGIAIGKRGSVKIVDGINGISLEVEGNFSGTYTVPREDAKGNIAKDENGKPIVDTLIIRRGKIVAAILAEDGKSTSKLSQKFIDSIGQEVPKAADISKKPKNARVVEGGLEDFDISGKIVTTEKEPKSQKPVVEELPKAKQSQNVTELLDYKIEERHMAQSPKPQSFKIEKLQKPKQARYIKQPELDEYDIKEQLENAKSVKEKAELFDKLRGFKGKENKELTKAINRVKGGLQNLIKVAKEADSVYKPYSKEQGNKQKSR